jgi:hypothetical protein
MALGFRSAYCSLRRAAEDASNLKISRRPNTVENENIRKNGMSRKDKTLDPARNPDPITHAPGYIRSAPVSERSPAARPAWQARSQPEPRSVRPPARWARLSAVFPVKALPSHSECHKKALA